MKKTEIEKQNVLLFNKMMRIMKRNDPYNQSFGSVGQGGRGAKMQSENSRIVEENRGNFLGLFRDFGEDLAAEAHYF